MEKVTLDIPDDVAERLAAEPDPAAYIAEAVRARMARETADLLTRQGYTITPEGRAAARRRLAEADEQWPVERRQALRDRFGRPSAAA